MLSKAITERPTIEAETALYGPDLLTPILMAIRTAENGSAGREFGVLSVSAPTYAEQLHIATKTVLHRLWSYPGNPLETTPTGTLRVTDRWVAYFASIWAPQGVVNDPDGLNANWVKDFLTAYVSYIQPLKEVPKEASFESVLLPPEGGSTIEVALNQQGEEMAIEIITLVPTGDQNIDSMLAFAKGLTTRGITNGALKDNGVVRIFMYPATAARYAQNNPSFLDDREAVMAAIKAAGYVISDGIGTPSEMPKVEVAPPAAKPKAAPKSPALAPAAPVVKAD